MKTKNFLALFGLVCSVALVACSEKAEVAVITNEVQPPAKEVKGNYTYLALGDSYTIGQSVASSQNFPNQLVDLLKANQIGSTVKIVAQTGWTTSNLINAIGNASLNEKYDFVTLLIGVNNQYQSGDINVYKNEFIQLLKTSISYAGGNASRVFVLSIPDYSVTPFVGDNPQLKAKIASDIDAYNQIGKVETVKLGANYLDITPISRDAQTNPALIANDGLHPLAVMYKEWVKLLTPLVVDKLNN